MSIKLSAELRSIGLDHLAELRSVHADAYRANLSNDLSDDQLEALVEFVHTPDYIELLLTTECQGAWIGQRLCATASWTAGAGPGAGAKLIGVCVDPMFAGLGLAKLLVGDAEARARRAGFAAISARAPVSMAPFFERHGYVGTARGVWATPCGVNIPIVNMRKGEEKSAGVSARLASPLIQIVKSTGLPRLH